MASFTAAGTAYCELQRADDSVLHLLLDVRIPAHRRHDLGVRRRARQGLPDGRHRWTHDARRRRPAASGRPQPRAGQHRARPATPTIRPTCTRSRSSCRTACAACTSRAKTASTTSRCTTKTTPCRRCRRASKKAFCAASTSIRAAANGKAVVQLFGSGPILNEALRAQEILAEKYGVAADVWSVTSYNELRRDALAIERWNRLHPAEPEKKPYILNALEGAKGPIIAATDYMKVVPDQLSPWLRDRLVTLGDRRLRTQRQSPASAAALRDQCRVDRRRGAVAAGARRQVRCRARAEGVRGAGRGYREDRSRHRLREKITTEARKSRKNLI